MPDVVTYSDKKYGVTEVDNNALWMADLRLNNKELQEKELWMFSDPLEYNTNCIDNPNAELRI
jgi:hypothetical protein